MQKKDNTFHYLFIPIVMLGLLVISCRQKVYTDQIKEGVVTYDIKYSSNTERNFPLQLLPKTMEMHFNDHFVSFEIKDRVGLFSIRNINDLNEKHHITLIKVFDKKYVYKGLPNESPLFFPDSLFSVSPLKDTARIIGLLCNKANVSVGNSSRTFPVWYYNNIGFHYPNANTPYQKIDGLLFDFMIQLKNIDMRLIAKNISDKSMSNSEFSIPSDYKLIPKSKMEEIITTLLP